MQKIKNFYREVNYVHLALSATVFMVLYLKVDLDRCIALELNCTIVNNNKKILPSGNIGFLNPKSTIILFFINIIITTVVLFVSNII